MHGYKWPINCTRTRTWNPLPRAEASRRRERISLLRQPELRRELRSRRVANPGAKLAFGADGPETSSSARSHGFRGCEGHDDAVSSCSATCYLERRLVFSLLLARLSRNGVRSAQQRVSGQANIRAKVVYC